MRGGGGIAGEPCRLPPRSRRLLVCVPTYNEAENIGPFIDTVFENIPPEAHILVIDDNSHDGTARIVEKSAEKYSQRLHLLNRPGKQGLASAYLAAFDWGLAKGYDVFLEMDADFSHNPAYIPAMLRESQTHDAVIGSRNIQGGGVEGWTFLRNAVSKGGSLYSRAVLGCPIQDLTGGFNMWTKAALGKIGLGNIISKGYSFQVEMKYRAFIAGCPIKEIPIIFPDRKRGVSKMSGNILFEALINIWKIKFIAGSSTAFTQFVKFSLTGGLGAITNLAIFFLCADRAGLPEIPVSVCCFLVAASQNYIINHKWSFKRSTENEALSPQRWLQFIAASLLGLAVNIAVMTFVLKNFAPPYKFVAQACGIAAGMIINFTLSKLFVWRKKNELVQNV
ncbi:MAG: glycosyltransferase family 2 protein [Spirochaetaceae bacterium]|nr:glycosyltransferase family 2 protein [Spirochaetaceae bacterium]